jgi:hypothetical protein
MKRAVLTRYGYFPWATVGEIVVPGTSFRGAVLELPWRDNSPNVSCVLAALYKMKRDTFKGKYVNYKILDVPGREAIELHRGNTVADTRGCPLIGSTAIVKTAERSAVLAESTKAFNAFMLAMENEEIAELEIVDTRRW